MEGSQEKAKIIDGKALAASVRERIRKNVAALPTVPTLAVILVGEDPASQVYVRNKMRTAEDANMRSLTFRLPATTSQAALHQQIEALNNDDDVDGILLQLPLPTGLDADAAIEVIDPAKDVDGLTVASAGRLALGMSGLRPCTPSGCVILAKQALGDDLSGKNVVVIGRSILVGKPAAQLFLNENCTVTIAHSRTQDLPGLARTADILIAAVGRANFVKGAWIKPGAVVIDVGINRVEGTGNDNKSRLVGDVAFDEACQVASYITPVPGGVGPMTIACLLENTVKAARLRAES